MVSSTSGETKLLPSLQMGGKVQGQKAKITVDYNNLMISQPPVFFKEFLEWEWAGWVKHSGEAKVLTSFQMGGMVQRKRTHITLAKHLIATQIF